jgi:hypothetical protein
MLGPIWSKDLLDQLYANSMTYLHGHSVGGTNPSLLRALGAGAPVIAWDVEFNRETTCGYAEFVSSIEHVSATLASVEGSPEGYLARASQVAELAATKYSWDTVADDYAIMCKALVEKHEPSTTRRSKSIVRETEPGTLSSGRPCEEEDRVRHGRQVWLQELRRESRPSFNE